jgi:hypothetical protein
MFPVRVGDCQNVQDYASKMQGYVNNLNLSADTSTGSSTMPKSEHSYHLMQGIPKDDDWKFFTQLMYDTINTLADNPEQIVRTLRAHEAQVQMDDDLEVIAMSSKLQTKSEKRNAKQTWKSRKSHDCHSESDGS